MNIAIVAIAIILIALVSAVSVFVISSQNQEGIVVKKQTQEPEKIATVKIEAGKTATLE